MDLSVVFLAEGRRRLPRWFFSYSTSLPLTGLMIQTRRDRWAGFEILERTVRDPTDMEQKSKTWYHSYLLIPRPNSDTKLAPAETPFFPLYALPHSKKASTDFRQCFNSERQHTERNKEKREVYAECENCHTWQSHKDDFCHFWQKVSPPAAHSSLTLECGPSVRFQT